MPAKWVNVSMWTLLYREAVLHCLTGVNFGKQLNFSAQNIKNDKWVLIARPVRRSLEQA